MLAAAVAFAAAAYAVWWPLDDVLGRSLAGQLVSVGMSLTAGTLVYAGIVIALRVPEAQQLRALVTRRLRRG